MQNASTLLAVINVNVALDLPEMEMYATISTSAKRANTIVLSQIPSVSIRPVASSVAAWPGIKATMPVVVSTRTNAPMGRQSAH